jgi:hypothetical protein
MVDDSPPDHAVAVRVNHGRQVDPPFPGPQIGDVTGPVLAQSPGVTFPFGRVDGVSVGVANDRGGLPLLRADACQSEALHGLGEGFARDGFPVGAEVCGDS